MLDCKVTTKLEAIFKVAGNERRWEGLETKVGSMTMRRSTVA